MDRIIIFLKEYFDFNILVLSLISSLFLLHFDSKEFKKKNLQREYKFSLYTGVAYIVFGIGIYVLTKFM